MCGTLGFSRIFSNQGPTVTEPCYISGSSDILTNINAYAQRRPGFSDSVEATPTTFINLQRLFTWDRYDGSFFVMFCDVQASGICKVYKYQVGIDASAVLIYTEASATNTPYDFVVSNNTVYFGNGFYMQKWDPVNGVSNWGIASASVNNATGPNTAGGDSTSGAGTYPWSNPGDITGTSGYATCTVSSGAHHSSFGDSLLSNTYGFSISSSDIILGISVTLAGYYTLNSGNGGASIIVQMLQNGAPAGGTQTIFPTTSSSTLPAGSSSYLWQTTWTPPIINLSGGSTDFGFQITPFVSNTFNSSTTSITFSVQNFNITVYGLGGPSISVSGSSGTMSATVGYQYVICYGNSNTGHVSSPSPPSSSTGVFTSKLNVGIAVTASTDPQVNQIRVFRTTDSATGFGGQSYFEIPTSPYPNTSTTVHDAATDLALNIYSLAPTPTFNDPPTPIRGVKYFAGRIWGFIKNQLWFSGLEEITIGVPEESFPSGVAGNFWTFDQTVQAEGVAGIGENQLLGVLCGGRLSAITGQTLDTFTKTTVSVKRGARNLTCVDSIGGMVAWLDSANQIWASDGNSLEELSIPIRPDLAGINQANCSMAFHTSGAYHWLVFSTGSKLFVYDIDQEIWMPPWSFACQYLYSGEISPGNYVLMASIGTKAVQLNTSKFNDNGNTYQPIIKTNLFSVIPDFGRRFNYVAGGVYDTPTKTGVPYFVGIDNNGKSLADVLYITDEDPTVGTYTTIAANLQDTSVTFNRTNGIYMVQNIYPMNRPACRWIGLQIKLANADQLDKIYGWYIAYATRNPKE